MPRILLLVPTATYRAGAFVRAAQKLPFDITIASEEPSSLAELLPDDLIHMDFADPRSCIREARKLAERHDIRAIIAVDDQVTVLAALLAESLGRVGNAPDAVRATRNKHHLRQLLDTAGVPQPRFVRLGLSDDPMTAIATTGFPCVVKPLAMSASRGVTRADSPAELAQAVQRLSAMLGREPPGDASSGYLVEEYVPGWEVAVEGVATNGTLHTCAIFDKPDPLEGPQFAESIYVTPSRLPQSDQDAVVALTQRALRAIGITHGPIHAEVRGHAGQLWFIETAARSIGGYCSKVLRFDDGRSLEEIIVAHAVAPDVQVPNRESRAAGVLMMQAPTAGRFVAMHGVDEVRSIAGVEEVIVSAHKGQAVTPLPEGFLYVGFVFARGDSPEVVESSLRRARDTLRPIIEST